MKPTLNTVTGTVHCHCGESVKVTLDSSDADLDPETLLSELEEAAREHHRWGSCGFCPACERRHQKDCAEINAPTFQPLLGQLQPI